MIKKGKKINLWMFLFFLSAFLLISNGHFGGDGLENYLTAESIVLNHNFSIHDKPFEIPEMRYQVRGYTAIDGKIYSKYGLGMAFVLVPFYFLGHIFTHFFTRVPHAYVTQFFVSLTNPSMLALVAIVIFTFLRRLGYPLKTSLAVVLVYSFCTMSIIYARSGFSEPTVAFLITSAALLMFAYSQQARLSSLIIAGLCVGYAIFIKKNSLILLPAFLLYFVYLFITEKDSRCATHRIMMVLSFTLPIMFSFVAILLQNKILYGGLSNTEFGTIKNMLGQVRTDSFPIKGFYYYLISSGKGYLIYNVALVLGIFAIKDFFKKHKAFCMFLLFLILSNIGFYSFIFTRGSIFSWGPRYLFPTLPLMAIFLAEFINNIKTSASRFCFIFLAVLGFMIQLPGLFISFSKYIFFVKEKLLLPEYFMDFMPDLSPIKGAWALFVSFIRSLITGESSLFFYNPDFRFAAPLQASLKGYDMVDIWWVNMAKVNNSMEPYAAAGIIILIVVAIFSYKRVVGIVKNNPNA
jgi:hypothetical protein